MKNLKLQKFSLQKLAYLGIYVLLLLCKRSTLLLILAGLSIYKPLALFQSLSLMQTFANIACNYIITYSVGAAIYMHNLLSSLIN